MTLIVGGDICPIGGNVPYFRNGDGASLFHDLLPEFAQADFVIANLECPLISTPSPIPKTGPNFGADPVCISALRNAGLHALCLANNHIMDHGSAGLASTLRACTNAGILTVGAGRNLAEARRPLIKQCGDVRLGVIAMAEREFSIATNSEPGANPLEIIEFVRTVRAESSNFDFLLVLVHGGDEFHVPTPRLQQTCRFLIEMGAAAVIVQHPHCLGGIETHQGRYIVYGQGALVMDEEIYRREKSFHEGFLLKLKLTKDQPPALELIPITQSDPVPGARRMPPEREAALRKCLAERSLAVQDERIVAQEWHEFCHRNKYDYLSILLGHNRFLRRLNRNGLLTRLLYNRRALLGTRNVVSCETHHEAINTILANGHAG